MTRVPLDEMLDDKTQRCPDCGEVFLQKNALAVHRGSQNTACSGD